MAALYVEDRTEGQALSAPNENPAGAQASLRTDHGNEEVRMKTKLSPEEFVRLAIARLRLENYKGVHSVYSGFNDAFKTYFDGANPVDATGELAKQGKIAIRPVKGGVMLYLPGEGPEMSRGDMALKKMGLLDRPAAKEA
jgi:hypothetical protein